MTTYEDAFDAGERAAFMDRRHRRTMRSRPEGELSPYGVAWWDGYAPRSPTWALRAPPAKCWQEVEEVDA